MQICTVSRSRQQQDCDTEKNTYCTRAGTVILHLYCALSDTFYPSAITNYLELSPTITDSASIIDYPTSMDQLPNHNAGKRFNNSNFWQSPENKSLGKKENKKLSDIVAEGGEEAQSALTSLFVEVLCACCTPHSNSSLKKRFLQTCQQIGLEPVFPSPFFSFFFPFLYLFSSITCTFTASFH